MKRILMLVVLCMSTMLVGCGGGGGDAKPDTDIRVIEVKETVKVSSVTALVQEVVISEGVIEIPVYWSHWATHNETDKIHFSYLAYPAVYQGDEHLKMVGDKGATKQIVKGVESLVALRYELLDEETPVTIKIIATTDDAEEGVITVDIRR